MTLFKKKTKRYIGVDFGTSSLKVVELEDSEGKPKLITYGIAHRPSDVARGEGVEPKEVGALLRETCRRAGVKSDQVVAGLPGFAIFSSIITMPPMKERELSQAVKWEAKKFIPLPLEEVILDWKLLKQPQASPPAEPTEGAAPAANAERVLLTAAPRDLVQRYIDIITAARLDFVSLETESFALTRSLVGFDPSTIMIIDIGAQVSHLSIVEDEIPILHRSLDVGGVGMTSAVAQALNVEEDRAEQFKRDIGLVGLEEGQGIPEALSNALDRILQEAGYLVKLYSHQHAGGHIEKIILTGGSSYLDGLTQVVTQRIGIPSFVGDPWARVVYPEDMAPALQAVGARMSVAIGLAMRKIV